MMELIVTLLLWVHAYLIYHIWVKDTNELLVVRQIAAVGAVVVFCAPIYIFLGAY